MSVTPLALKIAELREVKGWSQAELGRRSDVSQSVISRLERGDVESVHLPSLERLANALGCSPGFLIEEKD
jgi:transcriptional regulator with XRE-family HTH domain